MTNQRAAIALVLWLVVASVFVMLGGMRVLPPPLPQLVLVSLVTALVMGYAASRGFRRWVDALPSGYLVGLHLSRFVGAYFLVLYRDGQLPYEFAVLGGWGDIAVATLALLLLAAYRGAPPIGAVAVQLWNVFGLIDILFVVSTAARFALAAPESMAPITRLPLGLLPSFLVPLIIFSHGVVIVRGLRARRAA
jgi:hypothetical protein